MSYVGNLSKIAGQEALGTLQGAAKIRPRVGTLVKVGAGIAGTIGVLSLALDGVIPGLGTGIAAIAATVAPAVPYAATAAGAGFLTKTAHGVVQRLKAEGQLSDEQIEALEKYIASNGEKITTTDLATFVREKFGKQIDEKTIMNMLLQTVKSDKQEIKQAA